MNISVANLSSLNKHFPGHGSYTLLENDLKVCRKETFHFIQQLHADAFHVLELALSGPLAPYTTVFLMRDVIADMPCYPNPDRRDGNYLFYDPRPVSDLLVPLSGMHNRFNLPADSDILLWFDIQIPETLEGKVSLETIYYNLPVHTEGFIPFSVGQGSLSLDVLPFTLPEQQLVFTQWFHNDCIADYYRVPVYSEAHWKLVESFMKCAADHGQNMILTPVITPPLDTRIGSYRTNTQLMILFYNPSDNTYRYDWSLLDRYIDTAIRAGFRYFEISHLFSQWGLKNTPAVYAYVDGQEGLQRIFGWDHPSDDPAYLHFLESFIPALKAFLEQKGVLDHCFFHLSDEPSLEMLEQYRKFYQLVKPLLGDVRMMDALSNLAFYQEGIVETPVTATNHIEPFLEQHIKHQWAYYCCGQSRDVSNRFLAMPSGRNRMIGFALYLNDIEGFLQWGYNYYNSSISTYQLNPYLTTSGDSSYPSGDPFSVYPGPDGALSSVRQKVFLEALQDIRLCELAEQKIGKEAVKELIQQASIEECGSPLTFSTYPKTDAFFQKVIRRLQDVLQ